MLEEKKFFPEFKVYAPADLEKNWFVYWYEGTKRKRRYGQINQYRSAEGRRKAAEALIVEIKSEMKRQVTKTEEAVRHFLSENAVNWSQKTNQQYQSTANVLFDHLAGRDLTQERLEAFLHHIRTSRHPTTYNRYLVITKRLLTAAGYSFMFEDINKVRTSHEPAKYFQPHQATRLMKEIDTKDPALGLFVRFIFYCFIRPGELRLLKAGDVLLEEGEIRVPGEISKNNKTQFVVIPDHFRPKLNFLYDSFPGEYIFPSTRDRSDPVGKNTMYNHHRAILRDLRFGKGYTLYSWKHTGAVAAAKAGISIKELQMQLRHHSLDETDRYLRQMGVKDLGNLRKNFPGMI